MLVPSGSLKYLSLLLLTCGFINAQDFDLILQGGRIVDGMGNPWYRADLGIRDGRIAAMYGANAGVTLTNRFRK